MVRVRFTTNLGLHAANHLGLDGTKCTYESEVDVSEDAANSLERGGLAVIVKNSKAIKGIPDSPAIAGIAPVTRDAETESTSKSKKKPMPSPNTINIMEST